MNNDWVDLYDEFRPSPVFDNYEDFRRYTYSGQISAPKITAPVKHVVFDADGTIWTVTPGRVVAGMTFKSLISKDKALIGELRFDPHRKRYVEVSEHLVKLSPGFRTLLDKLDKVGVKYSLATLSEPEIIEPLLNAFDLAHRFQEVFAGPYSREGILTLLAAEDAELQPANILLVDDTIQRIEYRDAGFQVEIFGMTVTNMGAVGAYVERSRQ